MAEDVVKKFQRYARIDTRSIKEVAGIEQANPSSQGQMTLNLQLEKELCEMGIANSSIRRLADSSLLVTIPATGGHEEAPHIVLAAHVDTSPDCPGGAKPQTHMHGGGDLHLAKNEVIIPANELTGMEGRQIITSDGTTLLGADDKAGVAAIMSAVEYILASRVEHGAITLRFSVDEELGKSGINFFPEGATADWNVFITVDGQELEKVDIGCFNGAGLTVQFDGNTAHPTMNGDLLKPAHYAAASFITKLGEIHSPWKSADEEPYIYVPELSHGKSKEATVKIQLRAFDMDELIKLKDIVQKKAAEAADCYRVEFVIGNLEMQYISTEPALNKKLHLLTPILDAFQDAGIPPVKRRVRASTDGSHFNMAFPEIPTINIGTGGRNMHTVREFLVVEELLLLTQIITDMLSRYAHMTR